MNDGLGLAPAAADAAAAGDRALPVAVVGHVDHGKSTLVGRLLHDTGSLPPARIEQLRAVSAKRGLELEFSFLLDSLQVERDQGVTVDAAQIWFRTARRRYAIIDAPGHAEFLRNMVTGAAAAEAAVLVVDARQGVAEQTRRHGRLLGILGVRQVAVAVNKIDLVGHDPARFAAVKAEVEEYLAGIGLRANAVIPLSARHGDNVARPAAVLGRMPWYAGPTLVEALDGFAPRPEAVAGPLRLPVQDVYRSGDRRIVVGRIESGRLSVGDELRFAPGGQAARVAGLEAWDARGGAPRRTGAAAGENVALRFDREVFVERGHVAGHPADGPAEGRVATVRLFWLDREPLRAGDRLSLRYGTAERQAVVEAVEAVADLEAPGADAGADAAAPAADSLPRNGVGRVRLRSRRPFALDTHAENPRTGRGVLVRGHRVAGGFVVEALPDRAASSAAAALNLTTVDAPVTAAERAAANGHRGGVLWLTGLSGAGKSSLAMPLLRRLADRGRQAYVLDGDNIRQGLNRDLGFRPEDRTENIRRTAEVARLMADAGLVVVVALISPLAADRAMARRVVGEGSFHEVYVKAPLAACEARDPKGLYRKAREGAIREFTGVSAPYEPPAAPDLEIDTTRLSVEEGVRRLLDYAEAAFARGPAAVAPPPPPR